MLAATLSELYNWGGVVFMHPITLLFLINIGIIVYAIVCRVISKQLDSKWVEAMKQLSGLALAWGTFASLAGLFQAFEALEESKEVIPFQVIMGGLKVGLITVLYGLIVFCISQVAYIAFKFLSPTTNQ